MEELYLFDREENLLGVVPAEDLYAHEQEVELNKFMKIFATKRYDVVTESAYYIGHKDIDDNQIFQMYRPTMIRTENGIMDIEGIHTFYDEMKSNGYIKDKRPTNASVYTALTAILEGSRWKIGDINSSALGTTTFYYQSRLSAFWDFIDAWGVEFKLRMTYSNGKITGRYVDIYDRISKDNGKWFERGDKLVKTVMEEQRAEIFTALLGRGRGEEKFDEDGQSTGGFGRRITFEDIEWKKENGDPVDKPLGQPYVELPEATAVYGFPDGQPRIGIVEYDSTEEPDLLLQQAYEDLLVASRPKRELQAEAMETGLTELGEVVAIIDDETGIRYKTRVFKLRRNFLNNLDKTFTFGERLTGTRAERNVQIQRQIKKQEERTETWMNGLLEAYTSIYFNADGYNYKLDAGNEFDLPGGFYSFNAPIDENPTKMIYMGAGMLAISNSKDAQGNWIMKTFGTGDGFTADLMTAGRLDAERVRITNGDTDILWVDSATGEVVMNISKMTINAIPVATKEDLDAIEMASGKSAYEIAVENGYAGTEAQWLESLHGQDGSNGIPGEKGADGKTSYLHIAYANAEDGSIGFSMTVAAGKTFIGQYTDFIEADSDDYTKYTWSKFKGESGYTPIKGTDYFDGVDGQDGSDGTSSFLWVRYSQNANGYPMTTNPTNAVYIGVATTQSSVEPPSYENYQWSLIKGDEGTPGEAGEDGKTSYLHIKYSNDGGATFTANNGETVGAWIGTYVDFIEADSTSPAAYTWNKVKGEPGISITKVDVYYARNQSSTVAPTTGWATTAPEWADGYYIWSKTVTTYSAGNPTESEPVCITGQKGSTGATGKGISSITEEYYLSTSKTSQTGGEWQETPPEWLPGTYVWTRSKIVYTNPTSTSYTTPVVSSEWEAVNGLKMGTRNLLHSDLMGSTTTTFDIFAYAKTGRVTVGITTLYTGLYFTYPDVEPNTEYVLHYKMQKTSGVLHKIGGHLDTSTYAESTIFVNGVKYGGYATGAWVEDNTSVYNVDVYLKTGPVVSGTDMIYIQPNREVPADVQVEITDLTFSKGNVPLTPWVPAVEDVAKEIEEKATNESLNEVADEVGGVKTDLLENYAGVGDIQRLDEALEASNKAIEEARGDSIKDFGAISTRTSVLEQNFGDYAVDWNFVRTSIRFADEGVKISKSGEKTGLLIQNDKISFISGDNEVAYITGTELYITQGTFLDNVKIGQHRVSTLPSDSTITVIRYEG